MTLKSLMDPISVIAPTTGERRGFHNNLLKCFLQQTVATKTLIVYEDKADGPSEFWSAAVSKHDNVKYIFGGKNALSIGHKRNTLIAAVPQHTQFVAHFDDDDWYAPEYLSSMLRVAVHTDADLVKMISWLNYASYDWITDFKQLSGRHLIHKTAEGVFWWADHSTSEDESLQLGFGFSYFYKLKAANKTAFDDISFGEDSAWACQLVNSGARIIFVNQAQVKIPWVVHVTHLGNTSRCHPTAALPDHMIPVLKETLGYSS